MNSILQESTEVKECEIEWCHEPAFRAGLCFAHFVEEETARWDDQAAERETCLEGIGCYLFGDTEPVSGRRDYRKEALT